jgi:dipeptidyl aminopeptidase/acylaminoacyl peptidase
MTRLTLGFVLVALLAAAQDPQEIERLYRAATLAHADGDCTTAARQYAVVTAAPNRALAAKALLGMAECSRDDEARRIYARIVKEYGDQTDVADRARQWLDWQIGPPAAAPAERESIASPRLVAAGETAARAWALSRNGRWLTVQSAFPGAIAIVEMSTGTMRSITTAVDAELLWPVLSPDGREIVYLHYRPSDDSSEIRIVANAPNAVPRTLLAHPEFAYGTPIGWFPDGESILLLTTASDRTWQLVRLATADGRVQVLKSLEWRRDPVDNGRNASLSPDGRFIAYAARVENPSRFPPQPAEPTDHHIYLLAADGSGERPLVTTPGRNERPVWTPDGKRVLFISDRSGEYDLWSVDVSTGREELVRPKVGRIMPVGMAPSHTLHYVQGHDGIEQVRFADLNVREATSAPGDDLTVVGFAPSWSPDGTAIAFRRFKPGTDNVAMVVVRALDSGRERAYEAQCAGTHVPAGIPPRWFHDDGASLLVGLCRLELESGRVTPIVDRQASSHRLYRGMAAVSPDDRTLYVAAGGNEADARGPDRIVGFDVATGAQRIVLPVPLTTPPLGYPGAASGVPIPFSAFALSPDGRRFAVRDPVRVRSLAADGTEHRELYITPAADVHWGRPAAAVGWTADSGAVLFPAWADDDVWRLLQIAGDGGAPAFTGLAFPPRVSGFVVSPVGRRIAYTHSEPEYELWALDIP